MTHDENPNLLRQRIEELKTEVGRLRAEIERLKSTCPIHNPQTPEECAAAEELKRLNEEVMKLRKEMHEIARRLSRYEDVTGRFFLPGYEKDG